MIFLKQFQHKDAQGHRGKEKSKQGNLYFFASLLLCVTLFLTACGDDETTLEQPATAVTPTTTALTLIDPTATLLPTPTLAVGAPEATAVAITPSPTPIPSPTPQPAERVEIAADSMEKGDLDVAAEQLEASLEEREQLTDEEAITALYQLGITYLSDGRYQEAADAFSQLIDTAANFPDAAHFYLGQAYEGLGDYEDAIAAYSDYLALNPDTGAYLNRIIATNYQALGDVENTIAAYTAALDAPDHRFTEVDTRLKLADFYLNNNDYAGAIAQYDSIRAIAQTENTKGQMTYLAGQAELAAGNTEAAYARFQEGITQYPRAYESYLGLVALVDAGEAVDEFQRGLVDFYADAYEPAIGAFLRYVEQNPDDYNTDAHLYAALSYEALGMTDDALAQLDQLALSDPAEALWQKAEILTRANDFSSAMSDYEAYLAQYPDGENGATAAWRIAELTEWLGETETAVAHYTDFADQFPNHEDAPEALFRAGLLAIDSSVNPAVGWEIWGEAASRYPASEYGAAAMVWLLHELPDEPLPTATVTVTGTVESTASVEEGPGETAVTRSEIAAIAQENSAMNYYALRAQDIAREMPPFSGATFAISTNNSAELQAEAETWLRDQLGLPTDADIATLSPELAEDERLIIGTKLWEIGLYESAKLELESLRTAVGDDPLLTYQLALYFRDLGLYRSSIIAAANLLSLTGETVFTAPKFIGQLSYPIYYADLIVPLAAKYSFDPLIQFALVRQESLFESFARSGAAAQGLAQVIPDTGAYIAERLAWPNYENEDLYKPYVGLTFGAYYLSQQLEAFDGAVHAALSAYNAGPGNAARWYGEAGADIDEYVEAVDFWETRTYIERIYSGYNIYRYLYKTE